MALLGGENGARCYKGKRQGSLWSVGDPSGMHRNVLHINIDLWETFSMGEGVD